MNNKLDKIKGCLVGLAIGDALGVHHEFKSPKYVVPIKDYTEGNPYNIPIGYWTDDTSMALCIGQSLILKETFDAVDIMNKFCQWQRKGYMSSTDECFDIGNTTRTALMNFWRNPEGGPFCGPQDVYSAGNGSIMRLAPIPMFFHNDIVKTIFYSGESSRITHGYVECTDGCRALSEILFTAFNTENVSSDNLSLLDVTHCELTPKIKKVIHGSYAEFGDNKPKGTGYVVDCLEASLWAYHNSKSFEDAVLKAVNLGDDADTTGAVTGQIAGAFYGYDAIPQRWKDGLRHHDMIVQIAEKLYEIGNRI